MELLAEVVARGSASQRKPAEQTEPGWIVKSCGRCDRDPRVGEILIEIDRLGFQVVICKSP